jgi:methylglutaconyl-CoA hydratase
MENLVLYQVAERIATITINRPEKRNALNPQLIAELTSAFIKASEDDLIKVVILKANGDTFSAGADLAYLQQLQYNTFEENVADSNHLKNSLQPFIIYQKSLLHR